MDHMTKMPYEEFMEHVEATDSVIERRGDVTYAVGNYLGRKCEIGEYNHATGIATLFCV